MQVRSESSRLEPPAPVSRAVLVVACVATFLAFLDVTVVNVAFPDLRGDFADAPLPTLSWVITAYAIAFAALLTPAGRFADVVGRREVFLAGVAAFAAASAACALAPTVEVLIAARALQGVGAAIMIPAALGMVLASTPRERHAGAIATWGAVGSIAAAAGPPVGGALVQPFGWRAVFLVNVPVGLAALVAGLRVLPRVPRSAERLPDVPGTALVIAALALVVLGVAQAGEWGWVDPRTAGALGGGLAVLGLALARASAHPAPAVETSLWRNRSFAAANATALVFGAGMFAWMLGGVLFATAVWDYTILQAGLSVSPGAFSAAAAAAVAGRLAGRGHHRGLILFGGLLLAGVGFWLAAALTAEPQFVALWLPAGLISGVAFGCAMTAIMAAALASIPPSRFASATGLNNTARQVGGALGVAALATILDSGTGMTLDGFHDVYVFCALTGLLALAPALRVTPRRDAIAAADAPLAVAPRVGVAAGGEGPGRG